MATNLLFGTCDIPLATNTVSLLTGTADTNRQITRLFAGARSDMFRLAAAATGDERLGFDLGASTTKAASFLYVGKANMLRGAGAVTLTLKGHSADDYTAGTSVTSFTLNSASTLVGPSLEDYLATFSASSPYRYWWLNYARATDNAIPHAKLFFGTPLDLGRDPVSPVILRRKRTVDAQRKARYEIDLRYEGVSYTKTLEFITRIWRTYRTSPVVLYTTSYHDILHDHRAILCRLLSASVPATVESENEISLLFEELI